MSQGGNRKQGLLMATQKLHLAERSFEASQSARRCVEIPDGQRCALDSLLPERQRMSGRAAMTFLATTYRLRQRMHGLLQLLKYVNKRKPTFDWEKGL